MDSDAIVCASFAPEDCPAGACAVATGLRLDTPSTCIAEHRSFCFVNSADELLTVAVDPEGDRWLFASTTVPTGWSTSEVQEGEATALDWPDCTAE